MAACRACGHPLDDAATTATRHCPGCGRTVDGEVDWRTDTAEVPRVRPTPREPPHAVEPPPPARFPLYADEYDDQPPPRAPEAVATPARPVAGDDWFASAARVDAAYQQEGDDGLETDERRSAVPWVVVAVLVVAALAAAWWFLARAHGAG